MAGNTFGQLFTVTTAGESHGPAMVAIVDGCPPGLPLSEAVIQPALDRRRPGQTAVTSPRNESDQVEILSGVFSGRTTGTPIALLIRNRDCRSTDYDSVQSVYRPGHADYGYHCKYGHRDYRGGGRASARETVMRVAAGAIAQQYLTEVLGIQIRAAVIGVGEIQASALHWPDVSNNPYAFSNAAQVADIERYLTALKAEGDSVGALIQVEVRSVPVGLGEPVFEKLQAALAHALMGINAVKGVELGAGFSVAQARGSEHRDAMSATGFVTNHAGGILGGITTGEPIVMRLAFKPTSSIMKPIKTRDHSGHVVDVSVQGRHDPCVGLRAVPIVEAMVALVVMDHYLRHKAQNLPVLESATMINEQLEERE